MKVEWVRYRIVSWSSEIKDCPARALESRHDFVEGSQSCAWRSESGIRRAEVVLEFIDGETEFDRLIVGNAGSAFVEVFGTEKSEHDPSCDDADSKVLVHQSMLLSSVESRNRVHEDRVREFSVPEKTLVAIAGERKWKRLLVSCLQPFSSAGVGLSCLCIGKAPAVKQKSNVESVDGVVPIVAAPRVSSNGKSEERFQSIAEKSEEKSPILDRLQAIRAARFKADGVDGQAAMTSSNSSARFSTGATATSWRRLPMWTGARSKMEARLPVALEDPTKRLGDPALKVPPPLGKSKQLSILDFKTPLMTKTKVEDALKGNMLSPERVGGEHLSAALNRRRPLENIVFSISGLLNPERGRVRERGVALGALYSPVFPPVQDATACRVALLLCDTLGSPRSRIAVSKGIPVVIPEYLLSVENCARDGRESPQWESFALWHRRPVSQNPRKRQHV